ncbi:MAG: hypothetical protein ACRERE_29405 [Candidatus Entotheonellia bacterium]
MANIDDVLGRLVLDTASFDRSIKAAQAEMGRATGAMSKRTEGLGQQFSKLSVLAGQALSPLGLALTGGALVTGLTALTKSAADMGDELAKASDRTGISVETLSALQVGAELADTSLQAVAQSVRFMSEAMVRAAEGPGEAREAFAALGISLQDVAQLSGRPAEAFELIARRLFEVENVTNRTVIAQRLLGRSAQEQLPFLKSLAEEGIAGLTAQAQRFGRVISEDSARAAERFNDQLTGLKFQLDALTLTLGGPIIRNLSTLIDLFNRVTGAVELSRTQVLKAQIDDLQLLIGAAEEAAQAGQGVLGRLFGPQTLAPEDLAQRRQELALLRQELAQLEAQPKAPSATTTRTGILPSAEGTDALKKSQAELKTFLDSTTEALERQAQASAALVLQAAALADPFENFQQQLVELEGLRELGLSVENFGILVGRAANELSLATPAMQAWNAIQEEGRRVTESLRTPMEAYHALIAKLAGLLQAGAISQESFNRGVGAAVESFNEASTKAPQLQGLFQSLQHSLTQGFEDAIFSGERLGKVFESLLEDISRLILRALIFRGIQAGLNALSGDGGFGTAATAVLGAVPGAQHGGMFFKPTLAVLAEGGSPEVVVPMQRMEAWLDQLAGELNMGQGAGQGPGVEVSVINNAPNTQARVEQGPGGERDIRIIVDEMVADAMARPGSATARALKSVYGQRRNTIQR